MLRRWFRGLLLGAWLPIPLLAQSPEGASEPFTARESSEDYEIVRENEDPGRVYVVFRNPRLVGDAEELQADVRELLSGIVREALE